MKILSFLSLLLLFTLSVNAQQPIAKTVSLSNAETAALSWDQTTNELGTISQNVPKTAEFVLTNNSNEAIIITNVKSACGCTVPAYQKEPLAPGTSTTIKATYNAKKVGNFQKTIKVYTSASDKAIPLTLKGKVAKAIALSTDSE
ncbi:MAG: DUF1573 domain-containing protein [Saprospiraceae bacterium]